MTGTTNAAINAEENRRQVLYWRLLARIFQGDEQPTLESASVAIVADLDLPAALLDPTVSVDTIVQRFPELADQFRGLMAPPGDTAAGSSADGAQPADAAEVPTEGPETISASEADDVHYRAGRDEVRRELARLHGLLRSRHDSPSP